MALTTKALLNTTRQKNDSTYPLVIRMTYNRRVINIPVGYSLKEIDWDSENQRIKSSSKVATNITRLNKAISKRTSKIYDVVARLEDEGKINRLSIRDIKKLIISDSANHSVNVFDFIQSIIDDLIKAKKKGNAEVYSGLLNKLKKFLVDNGIDAKVHYPIPMHLQPAATQFGHKEGDFPVAEKICNEVLSLPVHEFITKEQQDYVIQKIKEFYNSNA